MYWCYNLWLILRITRLGFFRKWGVRHIVSKLGEREREGGSEKRESLSDREKGECPGQRLREPTALGVNLRQQVLSWPELHAVLTGQQEQGQEALPCRHQWLHTHTHIQNPLQNAYTHTCMQACERSIETHLSCTYTSTITHAYYALGSPSDLSYSLVESLRNINIKLKLQFINYIIALMFMTLKNVMKK